jgi:tRNA-dihydrouridine synthase A
MVTTGALIHGDHYRFLEHLPMKNPVAFQLGGSNPKDLAICAKMVEDYAYAEVNLNVGCPSDRVQNGRFGACLMAEPQLVADCVVAMSQAVSIPVTIKSRIGIDDLDSYEELVNFVATIASAGCKTFIVHARKAWLSGLSPKQNREVPPLRYDWVYQLKKEFPQLEIIINGGITTLDQSEELLKHVDGVMMGREAYQNPYIMSELDKRFFGVDKAPLSRQMIVKELLPYIQEQLKSEVRLNSMSRHILGLFHGEPGARGWRRYISENVSKPGADENVILQALSYTCL